MLVLNKDLNPSLSSFLNEFFNGNDLISNDDFKMSSRAKFKNDEDKYNLSIALPGYKKDDVNIEIDNDIITISSEVEKDDFRSSFKSSYSLPEDADVDNIKASMEDGILSININKYKKIDKQNVKKIDIM